jgi:pimeloyl-ACP methyl ester carboxylesterase
VTGAREVDLDSGTIRYEDRGSGPTLLFVHGVLVNGSLWRKVVAELEGEARCVVPDWPLGAHPTPMAPDADLSPRAVAAMIAELIEKLGLDDVTLVANDTGGALAQFLVSERPEVVARLVLTSCDCFENFFPPLFRPLQLAARVPGGLTATVQLLRVRSLRRLPIAFGWLTKRPIPDAVTDQWLTPFLGQKGVRRDAAKFIGSIDKRDTVAAAERLGQFRGPTLVAWAGDDRVLPLAEGRRLAELFPDGRFEAVPDSYTFVPEDQPAELARLIRSLLQGDAARARQSDGAAAAP